MRHAVERFQPLHLAVRPAVLAVTLGASTVDVRDAEDRVRSTLEPSGTTDDAQDVRAQSQQRRRLDQPAEEEVPLVRDTPPKLVGVVLGIVGVPELVHPVRHDVRPYILSCGHACDDRPALRQRGHVHSNGDQQAD